MTGFAFGHLKALVIEDNHHMRLLLRSLLKALGAQPLPLGDTGNQPTDPYAIDARRQATMPEDPLMQQFRGYQAARRAMGGGNAPSP